MGPPAGGLAALLLLPQPPPPRRARLPSPSPLQFRRLRTSLRATATTTRPAVTLVLFLRLLRGSGRRVSAGRVLRRLMRRRLQTPCRPLRRWRPPQRSPSRSRVHHSRHFLRKPAPGRRQRRRSPAAAAAAAPERLLASGALAVRPRRTSLVARELTASPSRAAALASRQPGGSAMAAAAQLLRTCRLLRRRSGFSRRPRKCPRRGSLSWASHRRAPQQACTGCCLRGPPQPPRGSSRPEARRGRRAVPAPRP